MNQQVSPCYQSFLTVIQSYHSKVTPFGALNADKIAEAVWLYVFRIEVPAFFFNFIENGLSIQIVPRPCIVRTFLKHDRKQSTTANPLQILQILAKQI